MTDKIKMMGEKMKKTIKKFYNKAGDE